ncbi:hypothetical protein C8A03DRAFT_32456 [Achaetomium macrosporum]|uniref:Rhodopsin domain-containing protein n=1 Tax=Achaetomium macrosporum TaxID=79813 RepID=A0AAN7CCH4_9PEZI|nr:hypothetical protein C8A03DRAFT_32456 [Achaetomium macrosporum]
MSSTDSPPGPDESKASIVVGVVTALHLVSWTLFGTRIWTRVRPTICLSPDDYFIILAVAFDAVSFALLLVAVSYGVGRHNYYVPHDQEVLAEKWLFLSQPPFPWSLAFSKVSISWMLLRIQRDTRWWCWTMYGFMVVSVGVAIVSNIFQLSMCKPLYGAWDHSDPSVVCTDPKKSQASIYVTSSVTIVTDVALSLAPMTFIIHIQRPFREKIALIFVMGLGIFASSASIAKLFMVGSYGSTGDTLMDTVALTTWSMVEAQLAIIAACIPTLKRLFERVLRRWGLISSQGSTTRSRTGYHKHEEGTSRTRVFSQHRHATQTHELSAMRSQRDVKHSAATTNIETSSLESGEMPIMKPSPKGSYGDFESVDSPAGSSNDNGVYFKTAIKAGEHRTSAGAAGGGGIQMETTVSVHTEPNSKRREADVV